MDELSAPHDIGWQDRMVSIARAPDSEFTALPPSETGLRMTVYASERRDCPVLVVDSEPGVNFVPSVGSRAFPIGGATGDPDVDAWVTANAGPLRDYAAGLCDTVDFHERMRAIRSS